MEIYLKLFEVLFPVFFIVGIGYYLGKKNPNFDNSFITSFASNVGTPAMVIYAITSTGISFDIYASYFIYYLIAIIGFTLTGIIILYLLKTKDIIREVPVFILPNNGNMGIPICLFAYGSQGLGIAASISSLIILLHFTLGVFLADRKFDFKILIKNPPFYAIIFSVGFLYFDLEMPKAIINLTELLTYTAIVLILMSLGIALTKLKVFSLTNSIISSIGRVIIGPIIGFIIIIYFDLSGFGAGVILIQSAMPSAILNYLIGSMYSPKEIVGIFFDQAKTRAATVDGNTYHSSSLIYAMSGSGGSSNSADNDGGRMPEGKKQSSGMTNFFNSTRSHGSGASIADSSNGSDWVSVSNYGSGTNNLLQFGAQNANSSAGDYIRILVKPNSAPVAAANTHCIN